MTCQRRRNKGAIRVSTVLIYTVIGTCHYWFEENSVNGCDCPCEKTLDFGISDKGTYGGVGGYQGNPNVSVLGPSW